MKISALGLALSVELPQVMIEGPVFLHDHDDVVDRDLRPVESPGWQRDGRKIARPERARRRRFRTQRPGDQQEGEDHWTGHEPSP